jgi:phospholipase C
MRAFAKIAAATGLICLCLISPVISLARAATKTPIHHLVMIVGENRSFDHLFATYRPMGGNRVTNLLSEGIVDANGAPGPNAIKARQWQAIDHDRYSIAPTRTNPFASLPQPNTTYAFGRKLNEPDSRFPSDLPDGPFQISQFTAYQNSFTGDPVHRFFQMWQQFDQGRNDLVPWVAITAGMGREGKPPPAPFTDQSTHQGGLAMGFYNMSQGDAPVFKFIADHYALSDNFHQGIMGGTGASFIYLGTGDIAFYGDGNGNSVTPPATLIEDPNPQRGSNNWYQRDGYESGSYVNCADRSQPGVAPILDYLHARHLQSRCDPGHYYLVNNYGPAYNADGSLVDVKKHPYTLPAQTLPNIAEALSAAGVSWKYYIGGLKRPGAKDAWCSICNPLQFNKRVMTGPLRANITDVSDFYRDIDLGNLPEVSFVRPYEPYSGHPANSTVSAYEYFILSIANYVIAKPELFANTAIMVTFDEGGGYYDSGYIQTLDFFGDGTRIPLLVISPSKFRDRSIIPIPITRRF